MPKRILKTPLSPADLADLKIADVIYLTGRLVTCRDLAHIRVCREGLDLPVDIRNGAIMHAGPIVHKEADGNWEMVAIGPTTSMRMEKLTADFIHKTGARLIIGKGGMGPGTEDACSKYKAIHVVMPAGNAVWAASRVKRIVDVQWTDLGMAECLWVCDVEEFGPLIVSIDSEGNNLFAQKQKLIAEEKEKVYAELIKHVHYIK